MAPLDVTFFIPPHIAKGLLDGTLIRRGGVIQDNAGRVVMWLKEIPSPASFISASTQTLLAIGSVSSMLTLGVSVIGFAVIYQKVQALENRLSELQEAVKETNEKIELGFYANFLAALDLARNTFSMQKDSNRHHSALQAINRFIEAEHVYIKLADKELERRSQIGDEYLLTYCLACLAETLCYLELGEYDTALRRFSEGKSNLKERMEKYIDILLTDNPLMYLHPKLKGAVDLSRLTKIYQWKDPSLTENAVFENLRDSLLSLEKFDDWAKALPPSVMEQSNIHRLFWAVSDEGRRSIFDRLPLVVEEMEFIIETHQRFASYESEIKLLDKAKIPFSKWQNLKPSGEAPADAELICICPPKPVAL